MKMVGTLDIEMAKFGVKPNKFVICASYTQRGRQHKSSLFSREYFKDEMINSFVIVTLD